MVKHLIKESLLCVVSVAVIGEQVEKETEKQSWNHPETWTTDRLGSIEGMDTLWSAQGKELIMITGVCKLAYGTQRH